MYQLWIPVHNRELDEKRRSALLQELNRAKPDLVLITFGRILHSSEMLAKECATFQKNKVFLNENGFQVGAWLCPTIGYGAPFYGDNKAATEYIHIRRLRGDTDIPGAYCPWDDAFTNDFLNTVSTVACTGVEVIMFEDDFTLGGGKFLHDIGCACDRHIDEYCRRLGETLTRKEIADRVFAGGKNPYRDLWIEMQKETLGGFVKKIESTVHAVNPSIRMGLSANGSSFEMEGATVDYYERILAGNTKPFLRLTGAPYWKHILTLAPAMEAVRLQCHWCGEGIDLMAEGDTFPRPRSWVPAAYLEAYDMILQATGCTNSILKYMIDYNASALYETGYIDRHLANQKHYAEIEKRFSGKKTVGLNIAEYPMTFHDRVFDDVSIDDYAYYGYMPLPSQRFLCDNSIPIAYGNEDYPSLSFGENTRYLTEKELRNGIITDATGARYLMERGIDIGIASMEKTTVPSAEYYCTEDEYACVSVPKNAVFFDMQLKPKAQVVGEFVFSSAGLGVYNPSDQNAIRRPSCFRYENADGFRFVVYSFVAETVQALSEWVFGIARNYCRQKQLTDSMIWFGKPLPAVCNGNPDLYILCKKDEGSMSVGLWNLFADSILNPEITLDETYRLIDCYNCNGTLQGNKVCLEDELPPYGFACLTVEK